MAFEGFDLMQVLAGVLQFFATTFGYLNDKYYLLLEQAARFLAPIATIAAGVFGIRQKILYAERNMHLRLGEYLKREEERLTKSKEYLDASLVRPGPERSLEQPIFTRKKLLRSLKQMNWGRIRFRRLNWSREARTIDEVDGLIDELNEQLALWDQTKADFKAR